GLGGWVGEGVRGTHAVGRADGRFEQRGATVDGELGLAGEDDEHFLTAIVEMLADAAVRRDDAAVPEKKIGGQRLVVHYRCDIHRTGATVWRGDALSLIQYIMADALRQRIRYCRRDK